MRAYNTVTMSWSVMCGSLSKLKDWFTFQNFWKYCVFSQTDILCEHSRSSRSHLVFASDRDFVDVPTNVESLFFEPTKNCFHSRISGIGVVRSNIFQKFWNRWFFDPTEILSEYQIFWNELFGLYGTGFELSRVAHPSPPWSPLLQHAVVFVGLLGTLTYFK